MSGFRDEGSLSLSRSGMHTRSGAGSSMSMADSLNDPASAMSISSYPSMLSDQRMPSRDLRTDPTSNVIAETYSDLKPEDALRTLQSAMRRKVYWTRFWAWREKLNQLKRQLATAQQLRDQLLAEEMQRSPLASQMKRRVLWKDLQAKRSAATLLQAFVRARTLLSSPSVMRAAGPWVQEFWHRAGASPSETGHGSQGSSNDGRPRRINPDGSESNWADTSYVSEGGRDRAAAPRAANRGRAHPPAREHRRGDHAASLDRSWHGRDQQDRDDVSGRDHAHAPGDEEGALGAQALLVWGASPTRGAVGEEFFGEVKQAWQRAVAGSASPPPQTPSGGYDDGNGLGGHGAGGDGAWAGSGERGQLEESVGRARSREPEEGPGGGPGPGTGSSQRRSASGRQEVGQRGGPYSEASLSVSGGDARLRPTALYPPELQADGISDAGGGAGGQQLSSSPDIATLSSDDDDGDDDDDDDDGGREQAGTGGQALGSPAQHRPGAGGGGEGKGSRLAEYSQLLNAYIGLEGKKGALEEEIVRLHDRCSDLERAVSKAQTKHDALTARSSGRGGAGQRDSATSPMLREGRSVSRDGGKGEGAVEGGEGQRDGGGVLGRSGVVAAGEGEEGEGIRTGTGALWEGGREGSGEAGGGGRLGEEEARAAFEMLSGGAEAGTLSAEELQYALRRHPFLSKRLGLHPTLQRPQLGTAADLSQRVWRSTGKDVRPGSPHRISLLDFLSVFAAPAPPPPPPVSSSPQASHSGGVQHHHASLSPHHPVPSTTSPPPTVTAGPDLTPPSLGSPSLSPPSPYAQTQMSTSPPSAHRTPSPDQHPRSAMNLSSDSSMPSTSLHALSASPHPHPPRAPHQNSPAAPPSLGSTERQSPPSNPASGSPPRTRPGTVTYAPFADEPLTIVPSSTEPSGSRGRQPARGGGGGGPRGLSPREAKLKEELEKAMRRAEALHTQRVAAGASPTQNPYLHDAPHPADAAPPAASRASRGSSSESGGAAAAEPGAAAGGGDRGLHDVELVRVPEGRGGRGARGGVGLKCFCNPSTSDVVVETVLSEGPAHRSGVLEVGDYLRAVDGRDVSGLSEEELKARLDGAVGSAVTLTVQAQTAALREFKRASGRAVNAAMPPIVEEDEDVSRASLKSSGRQTYAPKKPLLVLLHLDEDFGSFVSSGSVRKASFSAQATHDIAQALGAAPSRIFVADAHPGGSVHLDLHVLPVGHGSDKRTPQALAEELHQQASDPASPLRQRPTTRNAQWARIVGLLDPARPSTSAAASPPSPSSSSRGLPPNSLFSSAPSAAAIDAPRPPALHRSQPSAPTASRLPKIPPIFSFLPPPPLTSIAPAAPAPAPPAAPPPPEPLPPQPSEPTGKRPRKSSLEGRPPLPPSPLDTSHAPSPASPPSPPSSSPPPADAAPPSPTHPPLRFLHPKQRAPRALSPPPSSRRPSEGFARPPDIAFTMSGLHPPDYASERAELEGSVPPDKFIQAMHKMVSSANAAAGPAPSALRIPIPSQHQPSSPLPAPQGALHVPVPAPALPPYSHHPGRLYQSMPSTVAAAAVPQPVPAPRAAEEPGRPWASMRGSELQQPLAADEPKAGVGVMLKVEREALGAGRRQLRIVGLAEGGPAERSGMVSVGDEVLSVDGWPVQGATVNQVMHKVVGRAGTPVVLTLGRELGERIRVFLTREVVGQSIGKAVSPKEQRRRGARVSVAGAEWRGEVGSLSARSPEEDARQRSRREEAAREEQEAASGKAAERYVMDLFSSTKQLLADLELKEQRKADQHAAAAAVAAAAAQQLGPDNVHSGGVTHDAPTTNVQARDSEAHGAGLGMPEAARRASIAELSDVSEISEHASGFSERSDLSSESPGRRRSLSRISAVATRETGRYPASTPIQGLQVGDADLRRLEPPPLQQGGSAASSPRTPGMFDSGMRLDLSDAAPIPRERLGDDSAYAAPVESPGGTIRMQRASSPHDTRIAREISFEEWRATHYLRRAAALRNSAPDIGAPGHATSTPPPRPLSPPPRQDRHTQYTPSSFAHRPPSPSPSPSPMPSRYPSASPFSLALPRDGLDIAPGTQLSPDARTPFARGAPLTQPAVLHAQPLYTSFYTPNQLRHSITSLQFKVPPPEPLLHANDVIPADLVASPNTSVVRPASVDTFSISSAATERVYNAMVM